MGKENIEKFSAGYAFVKAVAGFWHNNIFYRRVIVIGRENISQDDHLIFAPNHQNALMDALAVLFTSRDRLVFLARADIFKKKLLASILYFLKILPVYRIRDGFSSLKGNDEIFTKTIDVIKSNTGLVILPEGDHAGFRRLRQLKKGICRVAFQSEEATGYTLNIKIVPVGLEFSHYQRFRQVLTVAYGKPIEVSEFVDLYKTSPERALNELREKLSTRMKGNMVHIASEEDYEAIDELRNIINGKYSDDVKFPKLLRDRELIDKLNRLKISDPAGYEKICTLSLKVKKGAAELKTSYRLLEKKKHPLGWLIAGMASLIPGFPIFLYGNIFNLTFVELPLMQSRKIKDPQFRSSISYAVSIILAFIFVPLYLILSFFIFSTWWIGLLIFLTLPLSWLFGWNYKLYFHRLAGGFRVRNYLKGNNIEFAQLKKDHAELLNLVAVLQNEK
jgi:1-acyl-sn-glycerol-3-phosphate acyltransferase